MDAPDAVGVSFFPLGRERYCILHTCYAGKEPSGRGDRRTYTRGVVTDLSGLRQFGDNPFALLGAVGRVGGLSVDLKLPPSLPRITLAGDMPGSGEDPLPRIPEHQAGHLGLLTDHLVAGGSAVAVTDADPMALAETVLRALPVSMRRSLSLSVGVPFSISRAHRLIVIVGDAEPARRLTRGTPYRLADLTTDDDALPELDHPWARTVHRFAEAGRIDSLIEIASNRLDEADMPAIEPIARICTDLLEVASAGIDAAIDLVAPHLHQDAPCALQRDLACQLVDEVRDRLVSSIADAQEDALDPCWRKLLGLMSHLPEASPFVTALVPLVAGRMSRVAPLPSMRMILGAHAIQPLCVTSDAFDRARMEVSMGIAEWTSQAPESDLNEAAALLRAWCERFADDGAAARALSHVTGRLAADERAPADTKSSKQLDRCTAC